MPIHRNKCLVVGLTVGVALGIFAVVLMGQNASQATKTEPPSAAARLAAAERVCRMFHDEKTGAPKSHSDHYLWSFRWMEAQRDVDAARGERFAALEAHLERMRAFANRTAELHKANLASEFELAATLYYVAEAEELLARARAQ